MPSTTVTFLQRWSAKPSPVWCAGDTAATAKDLSGHGAAAESALQAPEELLSPSWRVNNSTGKFLLGPRRWPLSAPRGGKPQCRRADGARPRCQPPALPQASSSVGVQAELGGGDTKKQGSKPRLCSPHAQGSFKKTPPMEPASFPGSKWAQPKPGHHSYPEGKPLRAPSSSSKLM